LYARDRVMDAADRATGFGLIALAAIVDLFFLRGNLGERFGDAVAPTVLAAAWAFGAAALFASWRTRLAARAVPAVLLIGLLASLYYARGVRRELDNGALLHPGEHAAERYDAARAELASLPPTDWSHADATGTLRAARYVAECTAPDDYLLVAAYAPESPVFAHRRFAAGQPLVSLSFYTSEADQRRAVARLRQQSAPIVLVDAGSDQSFHSDYPLLAQYVDSRYHAVGTIDVDDPRQPLRVLVENGRQPRRVDPVLGLPCFR
jgi:hypothetical protein